MKFQKATKRQAKARVSLVGPSGSGKTYTGLIMATGLGSKVAVIDTEHGSASKYADLFAFDVLDLDNFAPANYVEAIHTAEAEGYDAILIDSLSHAWIGKDGALEQADKASARHGENRFTAWRHVTPQHNSLIEALVGSKAHIVATMRSKTEYVIEENEKGKKVPRKIGMAPIQRDGMEYEFDVVGDMDHDNRLIVSKSRCPALSGAVIIRPGKEFVDTLRGWLTDGAPPVEPKVSLAADFAERLSLAMSEDQIVAVSSLISAAKGEGQLNQHELKALGNRLVEARQRLNHAAEAPANG